MNFVVDHGSVVFRTVEGTKLVAAVLGRAVAFEVDGYDAESGGAWSVVLKGGAVEIERMQDVFDALDLPLFPWHSAPKHPVSSARAEPHQPAPLPRRRQRASTSADAPVTPPTSTPG